jgi:hypothetical protein
MQLGITLAFIAKPWCSPVDHLQTQRIPTLDKATLWDYAKARQTEKERQTKIQKQYKP